jgi:hypothetical protein
MSTILVVCAVLACDRGFRLYRCSVISAREAHHRDSRSSSRSQGPPDGLAGLSGADDQNRTGDLVLTKDALCQLSYIGLRRFAAAADKSAASKNPSVGHHTRTLRPIALLSLSTDARDAKRERYLACQP